IVLIARNDAALSRYLALSGSVLTGLVALYLAVRFNFNGPGFQFEEKYQWLPPIGASYHLGLDGLSLLLVALTVIVTPVAILMADESVAERVPLYMALVMLLETSLLGVFVSLDLVLFYLFWEGVLIPAYLLIGVWGGERRIYAALKYVIYTMLGSLLMLAGVVGVYVYSTAHTFDIPALIAAPAILAVIGILYGALLALTQWDAKRLVACSSISHMCLILLGVFALNMQGVQGATIQMVNHGITTAALFAIVGAIGWRWGTTDLRRLGGLGHRALVFAAIFSVVALSALGLPGLNSFAGEFLILLGAFRSAAAYGVFGTLGVILAAWYMLRLFQGAMHGPAIADLDRPAHGMARRTNELVALLPLVALLGWVGVAPGGWVHPAASAARARFGAVAGAH